MAKLEYSPVNDFQRFNFIGKRLFDFVNMKINITSGKYIGNGSSGREITGIDLIPRAIIIFPDDAVVPVYWQDTFNSPNSKQLDGTNLTDGILGLSGRKTGFILGDGVYVNTLDNIYHYLILGS